MTNKKYMRPGLLFAVGKAIEEMGELNAALGKTIRFGWHGTNPDAFTQETNISWVKREVDDVGGALVNLRDEIEKAIETGEFPTLG